MLSTRLNPQDVFFLVSDMRSLIQQLENSKYSTILYVFSNNSRAEDEAQPASSDGHRLGDFFGFCDVVASQLSSLYNKNIILWPCPKMKVSVKSSGFKLNFSARKSDSDFNWRAKHRIESNFWFEASR
jgi:hypothetical protein